jgi:hypothetical protein
MGKSIEEIEQEGLDKLAKEPPAEAPTTTESSAPESVPQEPKPETAPPANA